MQPKFVHSALILDVGYLFGSSVLEVLCPDAPPFTNRMLKAEASHQNGMMAGCLTRSAIALMKQDAHLSNAEPACRVDKCLAEGCANAETGGRDTRVDEFTLAERVTLLTPFGLTDPQIARYADEEPIACEIATIGQSRKRALEAWGNRFELRVEFACALTDIQSHIGTGPESRVSLIVRGWRLRQSCLRAQDCHYAANESGFACGTHFTHPTKRTPTL